MSPGVVSSRTVRHLAKLILALAALPALAVVTRPITPDELANARRLTRNRSLGVLAENVSIHVDFESEPLKNTLVLPFLSKTRGSSWLNLCLAVRNRLHCLPPPLPPKASSWNVERISRMVVEDIDGDGHSDLGLWIEARSRQGALGYWPAALFNNGHSSFRVRGRFAQSPKEFSDLGSFLSALKAEAIHEQSSVPGKKLKWPVDCRARAIGPKISWALCGSGERGLEVRASGPGLAGASSTFQLGTDPLPSRVHVVGRDGLVAGLYFEGQDCGRVTVLRRTDALPLGDSGCLKGRYCALTRLDSAGCQAGIFCVASGQAAAEQAFDLCKQ